MIVFVVLRVEWMNLSISDMHLIGLALIMLIILMLNKRHHFIEKDKLLKAPLRQVLLLTKGNPI